MGERVTGSHEVGGSSPLSSILYQVKNLYFNPRIAMHFYWRIIEELRFLGESLVFHDPSLRREYQLWLKRKASVLRINEEDYLFYPIISLN